MPLVEKPLRFQWVFHSVEELERALEEYASFHDTLDISVYGERKGGHDDSAVLARWETTMRQNAEIDRLMARLQTTAPTLWRVLDIWYRHGLCCRATEEDETGARVGAWEIAAKRTGIKGGCRWRRSKQAFETLVEWAVEALFSER